MSFSVDCMTTSFCMLQVLMSDTVGFIGKLPTQLVAAFRATLEEIREAALILHVVDISHPNAAAQSQAVIEVRIDALVAHRIACYWPAVVSFFQCSCVVQHAKRATASPPR